jgi:hypothetical protein
MKHLVRTLGFMLVAIALVASRASAQTATIHGDLLKDWAMMKDTMTKIANAMPEDKFGFKSTPAQRSFGEHVMHIAQINMMLLKAVGSDHGRAKRDGQNNKAAASAATHCTLVTC